MGGGGTLFDGGKKKEMRAQGSRFVLKLLEGKEEKD